MTDKDKINKYQKQYKESNKEKLREYQKRYREQNKLKASEYNKQYRERNKEKIKLYQKEYYKKKKQIKRGGNYKEINEYNNTIEDYDNYFFMPAHFIPSVLR